MKLIDITGHRYGRLTVKSRIPNRENQNGGSLWQCICDCGNECARISSAIRRKDTTPSCGCFSDEWSKNMGANREFIAKRAMAVTTHGQKRRGATSPEYKTWLGMKRRCYKENCKDYPSWGGRGIKLCPQWESDFSAFFADMGTKPTPSHSIDRLDSSKDYSPENCRWATPQQQGGENKRDAVPFTINGETYTSRAAACRAYGLAKSLVTMRLSSGMTIEQAFSLTRPKSRRTSESYLKKSAR